MRTKALAALLSAGVKLKGVRDQMTQKARALVHTQLAYSSGDIELPDTRQTSEMAAPGFLLPLMSPSLYFYSLKAARFRRFYTSQS